MSAFKAARGHGRHQGPSVCLCIDCCRIVHDTLRCPSRSIDGRCGDFKGHRGPHTLLVATTFQIAEERLGRAAELLEDEK